MSSTETSIHTEPGAAKDARRSRFHASTQTRTGPAVPLDSRITVERHGDRLMVTIERRRQRAFSLGLDEAALLWELLGRELPPVTVRKVDGR